jgi:hypothetical protein
MLIDFIKTFSINGLIPIQNIMGSLTMLRSVDKTSRFCIPKVRGGALVQRASVAMIKSFSTEICTSALHLSTSIFLLTYSL